MHDARGNYLRILSVVTWSSAAMFVWGCDYTTNPCADDRLNEICFNCTRFAADCTEDIFYNMTLLPCYLKNMTVAKRKLSRLDKDSFQQVAMLKILNLGGNSLDTGKIDKYAFRGLEYLEHLTLNRNQQIFRLNMDWFEDLKSLTFFDAHGCTINSIHESIFNSTRNLQHIDLSQNKINFLDKDVFKDLKNLTILNLDGNSVSSLADNAFIGSFMSINGEYNVISFRFNKFKTWNETIGIQHLQELNKFNLYGNPIACNCEIRWFHTWLQTANVSVNASCATTSSGAHSTPVQDFDVGSLHCSIQAWIVVVASVSSVLVVLLFVAIMYRLNIRKMYHKFSLRRHYKQLETVT
ncbi:oplophorus-luciferin 2-monooxygenase non-catalytic subunit-like [Antedon mediterranea]|uniref:oplophorus-luciferin 2-monooxygenase non-catalytic subunit-like n=1 Tax=Antedon mediterranea TaxID=105859 RepID=UPI003AF4DC2F